MDQPPDDVPSGRLAARAKTAQWAMIVAASVALATAFELMDVPAGFLIGPMIAGILAGTNGATARVPVPVYLVAQALIGCLVAGSITTEIVLSFARRWPLFLGVVLAVIAASSLLGWLMSRWKVLPGSTAVWGSSPGGATAMMLMADAFGADVRLVAFMQYARVVMVVLAASMISRIWIEAPASAVSANAWLAPVDWWQLGQTVVIAALGAWLGSMSRLPAGALLIPLVAGSVLHASGVVSLELPLWLMAPAYALLGWRIGLGFTMAVLVHASRALPQILASIVVLLAFCGGLAFLLHTLLGIDPLTAYLATSPGGMDSIAVIAASTNVDLPFVMTLQAVRFIMVLMAGPALARFVAWRGFSQTLEGDAGGGKGKV